MWFLPHSAKIIIQIPQYRPPQTPAFHPQQEPTTPSQHRFPPRLAIRPGKQKTWRHLRLTSLRSHPFWDLTLASMLFICSPFPTSLRGGVPTFICGRSVVCFTPIHSDCPLFHSLALIHSPGLEEQDGLLPALLALTTGMGCCADLLKSGLLPSYLSEHVAGERDDLWFQPGVNEVCCRSVGTQCGRHYGVGLAVPGGLARLRWKVRLCGSVPLENGKNARVNGSCGTMRAGNFLDVGCASLTHNAHHRKCGRPAQGQSHFLDSGRLLVMPNY